MSEDMSEIIKKISNMINNNEIPEDIKNIMNKMSDSNANTGINSDDSSNFKSESGIDINTILKMKKLIDSMNSAQPDARTNLLMSLKPYLNNNRKEKVDQYVKLFEMSKIFDIMNSIGGDKKNNV